MIPLNTVHKLSNVRIVIIAKAPIAGFAKTRLIPSLGVDGAAQLAKRMLLHTVQTALASNLGPVEICATPDPSNPAWQSLCLPTELIWSAQGDGDLGQRMARAAKRTINKGEAVLLIGTDCPAIDISTLRSAADALQHHNAALVPTFDGGYALLALKRYDAALFEHMTWSTSTVAQETLKRILQLGWQANMLPTLHDVDEAADLVHLPVALI